MIWFCTDEKTIHTGTIIGIVVATVIIMALLALGVAVCRSRKKYQAFASESEFLLFSFLSAGLAANLRKNSTALTIKPPTFHRAVADDISTVGYLQFDIKDIEAATSNFLASNKIGQGGFGEVYKAFAPKLLKLFLCYICLKILR